LPRYAGSARSRTGSAVEYLICSIANDELTSISCAATRWPTSAHAHWRAAAEPAGALHARAVSLPRYAGSARSRTGSAVEYLICSIANDELTSNSGTVRISCL